MQALNFTSEWVGLAALLAFAVAYGVALFEERLRIRKSVPLLVAAALIWVLVGFAYAHAGQAPAAGELARQTLLDFAELFLFLIPAMTFVNTLEDRGVFEVLRARLISSGLSLRALFWVTGGLAFFISPIADNLTTALLLGAVAVAVGWGKNRFVSLTCVNIVVAANAGGAFSPFGDFTTLMVWQAGRVQLADFFGLFLPALVNWLIPAALLSLAVRGRPDAPPEVQSKLEPGAWIVLALFLATIGLTVALHTFLDLPPALGMMAGLGLLKVFAATAPAVADLGVEDAPPQSKRFDPFALLEKLEWDTLLFYYGVLLAVGGLGALGYLMLMSQALYERLGTTPANIVLGLLSAVVDNVPVMFAVLRMAPDMPRSEWLLVTLTTGVGGSLLSIGSAAGVALMGQARSVYTFSTHLRWTWAVALGFAASALLHLALHGALHCCGLP